MRDVEESPLLLAIMAAMSTILAIGIVSVFAKFSTWVGGMGAGDEKVLAVIVGIVTFYILGGIVTAFFVAIRKGYMVEMGATRKTTNDYDGIAFVWPFAIVLMLLSWSGRKVSSAFIVAGLVPKNIGRHIARGNTPTLPRPDLTPLTTAPRNLFLWVLGGWAWAVGKRGGFYIGSYRFYVRDDGQVLGKGRR